MGLTKEVRDFFTNRIFRLLDAKIEAIKETINDKEVRKQAVSRVLVLSDVSPSLISRYEQIEKERNELRAEANEIKNLVYSKVRKAFPNVRLNDYRDDVVDEIETFASNEFYSKVMKEVYPAEAEQIAKINHIKEDVSSVVLLSTSETKLVGRLTQVLEKYGGDIKELLEYIPE